jgi:PiT family inorganic phosphate transporter
MPAMRELVTDIGNEMALFKQLRNVPADRVRNFRNDMYIVSEVLRLRKKSGQPPISAADDAVLVNYKKHLDLATRFIPGWVKVAVAMALGLGTMVGWKRIVITVGEKIGKEHLTYAQGAAAEITAMFANHSGLQWATVRDLLMAWVLTLPVAMLLSGLLFWGFRHIF